MFGDESVPCPRILPSPSRKVLCTCTGLGSCQLESSKSSTGIGLEGCHLTGLGTTFDQCSRSSSDRGVALIWGGVETGPCVRLSLVFV